MLLLRSSYEVYNIEVDCEHYRMCIHNQTTCSMMLCNTVCMYQLYLVVGCRWQCDVQHTTRTFSGSACYIHSNCELG